MGEDTLGMDGSRRERVERALALLVQASRVSPPLRSAVAIVEEEIRLGWVAEPIRLHDCGRFHRASEGCPSLPQSQ